MKKKLVERQYRRVKRAGGGYVEPELNIVNICQLMKWDYWTYLKQPVWFMDLLMMKIKVDNEYAEINAKKISSKNG